jgi:SAM-dependent methyltransferase
MEGQGEGRVSAIQEHYDRFLAGHYLWMAGGFGPNAAKSRRFFANHGIVPRDTRVAIDLGAGCGFQTIPLAEAGFHVHAVDLCQPLLDELAARLQGLPVTLHTGNILDYSLWSGLCPELIVCMGDTLTHLPGLDAVEELVRNCHAELRPGGLCLFSFRDYSAAADGDGDVVPVQRDRDRIFLCRLGYGPDTVTGTDIRYTHAGGRWSRASGSYTKQRIRPWAFRQILTGAGFGIAYWETGSGMITIIAGKSAKQARPAETHSPG